MCVSQAVVACYAQGNLLPAVVASVLPACTGKENSVDQQIVLPMVRSGQ